MKPFTVEELHLLVRALDEYADTCSDASADYEEERNPVGADWMAEEARSARTVQLRIAEWVKPVRRVNTQGPKGEQ